MCDVSCLISGGRCLGAIQTTTLARDKKITIATRVTGNKHLAKDGGR